VADSEGRLVDRDDRTLLQVPLDQGEAFEQDPSHPVRRGVGKPQRNKAWTSHSGEGDHGREVEVCGDEGRSAATSHRENLLVRSSRW